MYAMNCTRLDIAYVVGRLSRYTSNPSKEHWHDVKQVLKYLKGTMHYCLKYSGDPSVLEGYTYASWVTYVEGFLSHVKGHIMHYKCLAYGHQFRHEFCYIHNIILPRSLTLNHPSIL